jgi:alpha-1,2-mannosyltransferase
MALLIALMVLIEFGWNYLQPSSRDFVSFWGASQFALSGQPALAYDNEALHALQLKAAKFEGGEMPFPYAPAFLLLVLPFGLVPFPLGLILWSISGYIIYLLAVNRLHPGLAWAAAAFPPVFATAALGQNGFVMAAIFLSGLALLPSRPLLAGMVLGCLILKPQLALMLPVAMLASGQWRTIGGAILSSSAVMIIGLLLFGEAATTAWLEQVPLYASIARDGLVGWHKLVSVYASARQLGLPEVLAFALHGAVAAAAAVAVWRIWRSAAPWQAKFAILSAATMLASPYLYVYDALILIPAFAYLVQRRAPVSLVTIAWLLPIATMVQVSSGAWPVNIGPLSALLLIWLVWRATHGAGSQPAARSLVVGN